MDGLLAIGKKQKKLKGMITLTETPAWIPDPAAPPKTASALQREAITELNLRTVPTSVRNFTRDVKIPVTQNTQNAQTQQLPTYNPQPTQTSRVGRPPQFAQTSQPTQPRPYDPFSTAAVEGVREFRATQDQQRKAEIWSGFAPYRTLRYFGDSTTRSTETSYTPAIRTKHNKHAMHTSTTIAPILIEVAPDIVKVTQNGLLIRNLGQNGLNRNNMPTPGTGHVVLLPWHRVHELTTTEGDPIWDLL